MISSVFALKEQQSVSPEFLPISETVLEQNFYTNANKFILECHQELLYSREEFYRTVLESSDVYAINESFNDIVAKIKKLIQKLLAYIDSIIKRFSTQLHKFVKSDKYINKKKDDIRKFPNDESFNISGYTFTFDDGVPALDCIDLSEIKDELRSVSNDNVVSKISKVSEINLKLANDDMDDVCAKILNADHPVSQTSFAEEVFSVYRDGDSSESDLSIGRDEVLESLQNFTNYDSKITNIKRLQSNITRKYKTLENQINDIVKRNISSDGSSKIEDTLSSINGSKDDKDKLIYSLNNLVASLIARIQKICGLHVQAIAGKLDAYNASVVQDRNILYKALSVVQKDINNSKFMKEQTLDLSISARPYDYARYTTNRLAIYELYEMNENQRRMVEECIALSERHIPDVTYVNEALKMDVKGKFEKLIAFIKSIYEKFLMKMNKLITNEDEFLKKYKDIILKTKVEEYTLNNMPDYDAGIRNITSHKLPRMDVKNNINKSEDEIKQIILPAYKNTGEDFTEFCKRYFLCDNKPNKEEMKSTELNMAELYAFCINAKAALKQLEADRDAYEANAKSIISEVEKAVKDAQVKTEAAFVNEASRRKAKKAAAAQQQSANSKPEGSIEAPEAKETNTQSNTKSTAKANLSIDGAEKSANKDNLDRNKNLTDNVKQGDDTSDSAENQAEQNKNSDATKVQETSQWYLSALQTVCSSKITAFQKIYSEYIKILRYHVSQATNGMGKTGDFTDQDQKEILDALKEYKNKTGSDKEAAGNRVISIYKSKKMNIDMHDVDSLVKKNAKLLEG